MGNSVIVPTIENYEKDLESNNVDMNDDICVYNSDNRNFNMMKERDLTVFDNNNKKLIKNKNFEINKHIKGIVYKNKNEYGDFDWMIKSGQYENVLFLFDDNLEYYKTSIPERGILELRKYNEYGLYPNVCSAGIIMGKSFNHNFDKLDEVNKRNIDISINNIKKLILQNNYKELYFSSDEEGLIKINYKYSNLEVINYATEQIYLLNDLFIKV